jgi:hypothetical protein
MDLKEGIHSESTSDNVIDRMQVSQFVSSRGLVEAQTWFNFGGWQLTTSCRLAVGDSFRRLKLNVSDIQGAYYALVLT